MSVLPVSVLPELFTICVEGNIGAGKTTLIKTIEEEKDSFKRYIKPYVIKTLTEPVNKWRNCGGYNLLADTSSSKASECQHFEANVYIQATLVENHLKYLLPRKDSSSEEKKDSSSEEKKDSKYILKIMERSILSSPNIFAKNLLSDKQLSERQYTIISNITRSYLNAIPSINLIVYIRADPNDCFSRIKTRGRCEEESLTLERIEKLHQAHEYFFCHENIIAGFNLIPVLILNDTTMDHETMVNQIFKTVRNILKSNKKMVRR
jgi:deoxyadenosine/deoxycytidine kinase